EKHPHPLAHIEVPLFTRPLDERIHDSDGFAGSAVVIGAILHDAVRRPDHDADMITSVHPLTHDHRHHRDVDGVTVRVTTGRNDLTQTQILFVAHCFPLCSL